MIQLGVIGAGHWGPNIINNLEAGNRSIVRYVVDANRERLDQIKERFPSIVPVSDTVALFNDSEIDAVAISTPTISHYDLARAALAAGKHVFVEKPLTHSIETSRHLCNLAKQSDQVLMVGHVFVFNSASRKVKEIIQQGTLGEVLYLSMIRTNLGPIRIDVDAAWDLAAHDISMANFWLETMPESVSASARDFINPGIADVVFANLKYPNGVLVSIHASWLNPSKARDITIVGDKRMLTFDDVDIEQPVRIYDKQVKETAESDQMLGTFEHFRTSVHEGEVSIPAVDKTQPLRNEIEHFLDCVEFGKTCESGPEEGEKVVQVLEAMSSSIREGREVRIDEM